MCKEFQKCLQKIRCSAHPNCVMCGNNRSGFPHLLFIMDGDGVIKSDFLCKPIFQGYPSQVHGGVISAVMDAAMTNRLFAKGITAVTARLSIQFHKPVKTGELAIVRAWILRESKRLYELKSEVIQNGLVKAEAEGKFIIKKKINIKDDTNMW